MLGEKGLKLYEKVELRKVSRGGDFKHDRTPELYCSEKKITKKTLISVSEAMI